MVRGTDAESLTQAPAVSVSRPEPDAVLIAISGPWSIDRRPPDVGESTAELTSQPPARRIMFDTKELAAWDSSLLVFITKVLERCGQQGVTVDAGGLPDGVRKLLDLASPERQRKGVTREESRRSFLVRVADTALDALNSSKEMLAFLGEATTAFARLLRGKADFRFSDLVLTIQQVGAEALPIVSLISVLVGIILAFVAAIQLRLFGAQLFVADVVGIGMARVMGAVMTGIIMAGRTGAAFAAQLGTMQVNEEIDALKTLGISPVEFLVLPRMLALMLMMPLLCIYSDFMGILGGALIGVGMLDLGPVEYYNETKTAVTLTHVWVGLFHSFVFGILVALSGCLRGMQCGRSASDVGYATTSAVVTGIVSIVVATGIITFSCEVLGI